MRISLGKRIRSKRPGGRRDVSAVRTDRKAQLAIWKANFASPDRAIYARLPDTITVSPVEPIAMEHGRWEGVVTATGEVFASGSYTAKWREVRGDWVIAAEIYVTMDLALRGSESAIGPVAA